MRKSKILNSLNQGKFTSICSLGHFLPFYIRYAAHMNFDGVWIDLEHQTMSSREVQTLLALCHFNDVDSLVRPATREPGQLNRYLEDGATGFMFPMVSDPQTAGALVAAAKYPPLGNRGFAGAGLDADFMLDSFKPDSTYLTEANIETIVCIQIETVEAVANSNAIAAVPGVDVLFVGPADLGLRLDGALPLAEAVEIVAEAAQCNGKSWGIWPSASNLEHYRRLGAQMLPFGNEYDLAGVLEKASQRSKELAEM